PVAAVASKEPEDKPKPKTKSRVVLVRRKKVVDDKGKPDAAFLRQMLDEAVANLFDTDTPEAAWRKIVRPEDVVGVKSNVWRYLPTPPALEDALRARIVGAGVAAENVAVDDRGVRGHPVFKRATALINVRPMRSHHWSGLGTLLKNYIMFVNRPPEYHGDTCATLGALWKLPQLEGKTRLNILVMLTPQFHGVGPHSFSPRFTWPYRGLIVSTDPVAADATGARIVAAKRDEHFGKSSPISPPAHHIEIADTRYGLGNSDPANIDLVRLGWGEGALI
ncbi:MAG: DUF362 domain-containing protein, partial [Acidobacteriota bacterium]